MSSELDPLFQTWEAGVPFFRCHDSRFGATEFNPGLGGGRFHPVPAAAQTPIPTLYGSNTVDGVLSETVFHSVPVHASQRGIRRKILLPMMISSLSPNRPLRLIQLHGHGLRRLRAKREQVIESDVRHYPTTRHWAARLHAASETADGLIWVSRQHDTSLALMLFGDRVDRDELSVVRPPLPLAWGPGFTEVQRAAEEADILVIL